MYQKKLILTFFLSVLFFSFSFAQDKEGRLGVLLNKSKAELIAFKQELVLQNQAIMSNQDDLKKKIQELQSANQALRDEVTQLADKNS
ncbi:MAG: hypothetical protein KDD63_05280, partial [Bacteroidetes bacterium]|nr:hypothetical protein [Bacteroidota bacterium]